MRLNQRKIEEVILTIIGEEGSPLIRELYGKENISEFDLANKTKKDIKLIRKMLYLLYNNNLVGFTRKKDKLKGWYIYYWTLLPESVTFLYIKRKKELLASLKQRLEEGKELFFVCKNNCIRLNFDQATDFEFHCPECGELVSQDKLEEKELILKQIKGLEEEITNAEKEERRTSKAKPRRIKIIKKKAVKKVSKKKLKKPAAKNKIKHKKK